MGILDELRNENPKKLVAKTQVPVSVQFLAIIAGKVLQYAILTTIGYLCWNYVIPVMGGVYLTFWQILALLILVEIFIYRVTGGNRVKY